MSARLRWRTALFAGAMSASLTVGCGGGGSSSATSDGADSETGDTDGGDTDGGDTSGGGVDDVPGPQPSEGFEAGFDVRDISPNDAELMLGVYMGAYGAPEARGVATGVHDPVYARTVALREGDEEVIMTILDLPGLGNRYTRRIREDVAALTGLDPLRILVGATHSHSSPDFMGLWGGVPDAYADRVVSLVVGGMVDALNNADPVDLHVGTVQGADISRLLLERVARRRRVTLGEARYLNRTCTREDVDRLRQMARWAEDAAAQEMIQAAILNAASRG